MNEWMKAKVPSLSAIYLVNWLIIHSRIFHSFSFLSFLIFLLSLVLYYWTIAHHFFCFGLVIRLVGLCLSQFVLSLLLWILWFPCEWNVFTKSWKWVKWIKQLGTINNVKLLGKSLIEGVKSGKKMNPKDSVGTQIRTFSNKKLM